MTSIVQFVVRFVRTNWSTLLILGGLLAAWLFLQTRSTPLASFEEFEQRVQAGQPVVAVLFSNT